ncbi:response regulator [Pseudorhodoferax sp. LjRoot39]|uniref:hypothetical protein n=1 Tax=Pseudorhodoferax sp. LjRoot39 TaxID=3342328 RepID=UPI003ECE4FF0
MATSVLLIEDNSFKRVRIIDFLQSLKRMPLEITEAHSFSSGCQEFESKLYDIVIADISLPTYDKNEAQSGGRFRPFAGREIGRKISRHHRGEKIIFITQYKSFSDKGASFSFEQLKEIMLKECGSAFFGMIYYDGSQISWKNELELMMFNAGKNC